MAANDQFLTETYPFKSYGGSKGYLGLPACVYFPFFPLSLFLAKQIMAYFVFFFLSEVKFASD